MKNIGYILCMIASITGYVTAMFFAISYQEYGYALVFAVIGTIMFFVGSNIHKRL